jgi:hypothetical protein
LARQVWAESRFFVQLDGFDNVIFPESMADYLANPVDICFGSMPTTSTAPAACLVIEGNAVTTNQQIETDLFQSAYISVS